MNNTQVRGFKLLKKAGIEVSYVFHDTMNFNGEDTDIPRERKEKIYADPKATFFTSVNLLKSHLLAVTELGHTIDAKYIKGRTALEDPRMEKYRVTEAHIKGDLDDTAIQIKGHRVTKRGKEIPLDTGWVKIYDTNEYEFSGNLAEDWNAMADEVEAFYNGSYTPSGQLEFDLS